MSPNNPVADTKKVPELQHRHHGMKVSEVLRVIRHRRALVISVLILAVVGTFLGHFVYTPTYRAEARISVKTEAPNSIADYLGAGGNMWSNRDYAERVHNYVQFIKSNSFLLRVAQVLKFRESEDPLIFEVPENLSIFQKDFWEVVYENMTHQQLSKRVKAKNNLTIPVETISSFIGSVMKVSADNMDQISVSIQSLDAFTSMTIANTIVNEFTRITNEHDARGLMEVKKLLEEKLNSTKEKLKSAEIELIEFKKQNRISGDTSQSTFYSTRLNEIEKEIEKINLKLAENEKLISFYEKAQSNRLKDALDSNTDVDASQAQAQFVVLNQQLDGLRQQKNLMLAQQYAADHWRVKKVDSEISNVAQELKSLLANHPSLKDGEINDSSSRMLIKVNTLKEENRLAHNKLVPLEKSRQELLGVLQQVPQAEQIQLMLQRKLDLEYENFSTLQKKMNEVEIQLVSLDKKVLIDRLSPIPSASKRRNLILKVVFSALVGLFFGCLMALLLEQLDSSIRHKADLEEMGIHFLGEIPDTSVGKPSSYKGVKSPNQIVTLTHPNSLDAVIFDFVRSRLESSRTRSGKTSNSITITSVNPNEGKSFVAANLAVSLAQLGKKTLLLDSDLRSPSMHCYFDLANDQGLVDLFESDVGLEDVLHKEITPNLDVLTAGWGCKAPTVLISSEKFRVLMKYLRSEYDYVVVDTPPVAAVADSSILSNMTDSVVLVTRYRSTTRHDVIDAQFKIHHMSSKRIHGIINFAKDREDIATYYPYVMPRTVSVGQFKADGSGKKDDLRKFEEQLKGKRSG